MEMLRHTGIVKQVTPTALVVSIINQSACSGCHAQGACNISDVKEKEITVTSFHNSYQPGNVVTVIFRESLGIKALMLGYIFPLLLLLFTLVLISELTGNEILAAFVALGILVPYYLFLYVTRGKLKKEFTFELEETN